jgi:hypothetical protein
MKNKLLLWLLALLATLRFFVVPLVDWQNEAIQRLSTQSKQHAKQQALVDALPVYTATNIAMQQAVTEVQALFYSSVGEAPLQTQLLFNRVARSLDVKVARFEWVAVSADATPKGSFKVSVLGTLNQLSRFHLAVEGGEKLVSFTKWNMRQRQGRNVEDAPYEIEYEGYVLVVPEFSASKVKPPSDKDEADNEV